MNDVKAAAERVLKRTDRTTDEFFRLEEDAELLAHAYLSEHPADEDEPISEDWLRDVAKDSGGRYFVLSDERGEEVDVVKWSGGWNMRIHGGANCHTRGDLRRLCAALGIEIKEPNHA